LDRRKGKKEKKILITRIEGLDMISREEMHKEFVLRESIKKTIKNKIETSLRAKKTDLIEEIKLRSAINKILREAEQDPSSDPHPNTGINFLKVLFKNTNFLASLEEAYKSLTTTDEQRKSFESHIFKGIEMTFSRLDDMDTEDIKEEVDLDIAPEETPGYVEKNSKTKKDEENDEREEFDIVGTDETGRNVAFETYKKVEKSLIDQYVSMGDDDDRAAFKKYLMLNLQHYFDQWESELSPTEPSEEEQFDEV
tara:strand:+ start:5992 stop:6750 length:759 start_codon:yes stop_codon:yes gene_type:complete